MFLIPQAQVISLNKAHLEETSMLEAIRQTFLLDITRFSNESSQISSNELI